MDILPKNKLKTYLDFYEKFIAPKLMEIDIIFKTKTKTITISKAAELLNLSELEVRKIIEERDIKKIDQMGFFEIMEHGSSEICVMFKNEVTCGMPFLYNMEDVSFIYGLDIGTVVLAFRENKITEASSMELKKIFSYIPLKNAYRLFS